MFLKLSGPNVDRFAKKRSHNDGGKLFFKNRLPVARGGLGLRCPMRTGRLAGVATNKTVCSRRIRRHFFGNQLHRSSVKLAR
jgi:hypothetical protein